MICSAEQYSFPERKFLLIEQGWECRCGKPSGAGFSLNTTVDVVFGC
jgi:hypothetical protein